MAIVYLSLGSNLGDRVGYLQQATSLLSASEKINVVATSSFYESEPWSMNSENWFVNAVIQISTTFTPEELLNECQRIENQLGRKRIASRNYIDRTLDIDILFYDDLILYHPDLIIPHIDLENREFVLQPMCELNPFWKHPVNGKSMKELLSELKGKETV